jgi:hypothetical protein
MKKIFACFLVAGSCVSCSVDSSQTIRYWVNEPVFTTAETFRRSIQITSGEHTITDCGKICLYNDHLYISEPGKGILIVDNTHPSQPQVKGYIEAPAHRDIIVRGQQLYVDALVDLVWFDLSNPSQPVLQGRSEDLFPGALPLIKNSYGYDYALCRKGIEQGKIVVGWQLKERRQQISYSDDQAEPQYSAPTPILSQGISANGAIKKPISRMALFGDYLYTIVNQTIQIVDLSEEVPQKITESFYVETVESVFPCHDKLFLGTPHGLMIYSLERPQRPVYCSKISPIYGCNPIVIHNDKVYASIHSGNLCGQNTNELLVIDVSDPQKPRIQESHPMNRPRGISMSNGSLFLCDDGLKIHPLGEADILPNTWLHFKGINGYNVVAFDRILIMITDHGLHQYEYTEGNLLPSSVIPIS